MTSFSYFVHRRERRIIESIENIEQKKEKEKERESSPPDVETSHRCVHSQTQLTPVPVLSSR